MEVIVKKGMLPEDIRLPGGKERMSEQEFFHFASQYPNRKIERDSRGNILIMPPVNMEGGSQEVRAIAALDNWNEETGLGVVFSSNAAFTLPNGAVRSADAAWIEKSRYYGLSETERQTFSHICPDFVIEIRSKSDSLQELQDKMQEYMANGVRLAFLIDPIGENAVIYHPGKPIEFFDGLEEALSGEPVLPGFILNLKRFKKHV